MWSKWVLLALSIAIAAAQPAPDCRLTLRALVAAADAHDEADLRAFYEPTAYALAWVRDRKPTPQAETVIQVLKAARTKGFNAEDYDGSQLADAANRLRLATSRSADRELAHFDVMLTASVMHYVSDVHLGRANPKLIHRGFDIEHEKLDLPAFVRDRLANAGDLRPALAEIDPPFPGYRRTEIALQRYLDLADNGDAPPLPTPPRPVEPGSTYASADGLAHLLRKLGDLDPSATLSGDTYTGPLVEALKRFQTRHGLDPDGRIGATTLRQLNTPLSRRVRQLELTLERYRWAPHHFTHPPVIVNIPEFRLRAMNSSFTADLEMKVVVGRAYRTRTPVFTEYMKFVIFRPYWEVPPSIQRGELVPKISRDKDYLQRNGYEMVSAEGNLVTRDPTDAEVLAKLRSGQVRIRQVPGPRNALGLVKFLFPNEFNVYMHDTPATELFSRPRRDFSHGCIRVERPEALAQWVLKEKPEWTPARIAEAMHGETTVKIALKQPIPVLIVYATAIVLEGGDVHFLDDIYGHDAALDIALTSGGRGRHPRE